jgi:hypothetical protein
MNVVVDDTDDIKLAGNDKKGRHRAVRMGFDLQAFSDALLQSPQKVLSLSQILQNNGTRLSVHASRLNDIPILVTSGHF